MIKNTAVTDVTISEFLIHLITHCAKRYVLNYGLLLAMHEQRTGGIITVTSITIENLK